MYKQEKEITETLSYLNSFQIQEIIANVVIIQVGRSIDLFNTSRSATCMSSDIS